VVATYPQGCAVDVLLPDSGSRLTNVQVMLSSASDSSGTVDLPDPGLPTDDTRWNLPSDPTRNIIAVVQSYKGNPVCTGFIMPKIGQMTFDRVNFRVFRHASDVYTTINEDGDTELYHPSGTYFRIGASPAHEDLTGQDYDGKWAIANNTAAAPYVKLALANAGVVKATLEIDPSGNMTVTAQTITATIGGDVSVTANQVTINGVTIDSSGNLHSPATITGQTDVKTGAGTSLDNHLTSGVTTGSSESGPPVAGT
jgi:hypothetical protein